MQLKDLILNIYSNPLPDHYGRLEIVGIATDSRLVKPGEIFVAIKGPVVDGNKFVDEVILKGVSVIASTDKKWLKSPPGDTCFLIVQNTQKFLREITLRFYGNPTKKIISVGVTGTNGKTTTTYLMESILDQFRKTCAVVGTINCRVAGKILPSKNTTPGFLENQKLLADLVEKKIDYCVMEVSSHALDQGRVDCINFKAAIFTNLTGDHLDYHKTIENYFQAKLKLFKQLSSQNFAIINIDDLYGAKILDDITCRSITYGIKNRADVTAKDIKLNVNGTQFKLVSPAGQILLNTHLVGEYNVYNVLGAVAASLAIDIPLDAIKRGIEQLKNVPGRLEKVDCGQDFAILIDYAHTHDALENVLKNIRLTSRGRIILVFGCGGDRDKTKRPKMGLVASRLADQCIVTSDNPRTEDPQSIVDQVLMGFERRNFEVVIEREAAIAKALSMAQKDDVVLIAGKGHENYQIFKDKTIEFDERKIIQNYFQNARTGSR